jgi:hypothetical protein
MDKALEAKIKLITDRAVDLKKFELIKLICESYTAGEGGRITDCTVLDLISGIVSGNISKVRKAMSSLKFENFTSRLDYSKLEMFTGDIRKGSF